MKKQGYKSMGKMQSAPLPKTAQPAPPPSPKGKGKKKPSETPRQPKKPKSNKPRGYLV